MALSREAGGARREAGRDSSWARAALLLSLALAWLNFFLTSRWAAIPGSVHGPKRPYYLAALVVASVLALLTVLSDVEGPALSEVEGKGERVRLGRAPAAIFAGGCLFLFACFMLWFPPSTWSQVPFLDDWPPRFQSTVEGVRLLRHAAFSGWRWDFLGGYPIATDVTQDLTAWAALPMLLFGAEAGFHFAHLVLFAAIPALIWWDVRKAGDADVAALSAGLAAIFSANYSYFLIRSGDTNSLTGAVAALATLVAAHAARVQGRSIGLTARWGAPFALVGALTLTNYSHRGFFLYALLFLALDAAVARDRRSLQRAAVATAAALVAGLPVTWDLWRYPQYFIANNVALHPAPFELIGFLRKVYYNTELLLRPGRWFNDFTGLTNVFLPVIAYAAWRAKGRARFYAFATLGVVCLVRLIYDSFGYVFLRPIIFLPMFVAPPLAWFIVHRTGRRALALALVAFVSLYIQVWFGPVPHVKSVRDFDAALVDRLSGLDGDLVLVENAFHRDVDVSPAAASVPTPFPAHFEALLPAATGRRLYAGMWDGWQWTPYRDQVFAGGTFRGRALRDVPVDELERELQRWGIRHLLVWSDPATKYLDAGGSFRLRNRTGRWSDYEYVGESVSAAADLIHRDAFGGVVRVNGARSGATVTVRTNYHPAWAARADGRAVPLFDAGGQLAFTAPRDGDIEVGLVYPRRPWLLPLAGAALLLGAIGARIFT